MKKLLCIAVSLVALLCAVLPVSAKGYDSGSYQIDMDEYDLGFKVSMPNDYTVFPSYEDKSLEELGFFFDSADSPDFNIPGYSLNTGYEDNLCGITGISDMTGEQFDAFSDEIVSATRERYGLTTGEMLFVTKEVNDNLFLKVTFSATGGGRTAFFTNYYIVINGNLLRFSAIAFTMDGDEAYEAEAETLAYDMVNSVIVTGTIGGGSAPEAEASASKFNPLAIEFPFWIFFIIFAAILLIGAKFSKPREWQEEPFSLDKSKCIQGFCAIAIILHHMSQTISFSGGDPKSLGIMLNAGVLFVGIFFFFSGYGLTKSLLTKKDYLKGFLKKRLPAVIIPFFTCVLFFVLTGVMMGRKFSLVELLEIFTGVFLINSHMWYIVEIVILYIAFFLIFRYIKDELKAFITMTLFAVGLVVLGVFAGHGGFWFQGEWWFNTTLLFIVGLYFAKFEEEILEFARKRYIVLLLVCAALFTGFWFLNSYALDNISYYVGPMQSFECLGAQLPMVVLFVALVLLLMMKIKFTNPVLKFLGSISLEIYLIHNFFIENLRSSQFLYVKSNSLYILLVFLCAIAVAVIVSGIDKYLVALFAGKKTPSFQSEGKIHSIDAMRFIAALLVVVIHIPFSSVEATGITIAFGKIAVPFFLVVCGYFLWRNDEKDFMARLKKQAKKILLLTVAANVIYTAIALVQALTSGATLSQFAAATFTRTNLENFFIWNMSPFGDHLWYLGSLLYAILMLMLLCKLKLAKKAMFIAPVLLGGYIALSWTMDPVNYFMYRNALLCTLPYVLLGCMISRFREKLMSVKAGWYIAAGILLCITNVVEYNLYKGNVGVPYFSAELLVYAVVLILLKFPSLFEGTLMEKLGRDCSLFVYIMHIAVATLLFTVASGLPFMNTFAPVIVFIVTILLALVWNVIKGLFKKKNAEEKK